VSGVRRLAWLARRRRCTAAAGPVAEGVGLPPDEDAAGMVTSLVGMVFTPACALVLKGGQRPAGRRRGLQAQGPLGEGHGRVAKQIDRTIAAQALLGRTAESCAYVADHLRLPALIWLNLMTRVRQQSTRDSTDIRSGPSVGFTSHTAKTLR
jgi:hypothetical protein